jgi:hypothetical protein
MTHRRASDRTKGTPRWELGASVESAVATLLDTSYFAGVPRRRAKYGKNAGLPHAVRTVNGEPTTIAFSPAGLANAGGPCYASRHPRQVARVMELETAVFSIRIVAPRQIHFGLEQAVPEQ